MKGTHVPWELCNETSLVRNDRGSFTLRPFTSAASTSESFVTVIVQVMRRPIVTVVGDAVFTTTRSSRGSGVGGGGGTGGVGGVGVGGVGVGGVGVGGVGGSGVGVPLRTFVKVQTTTSPFAGKLWLAPLTRGGHLAFRRLCVEFGAQVTVSEMVVVHNLLRGRSAEFALLKSHASEPFFGVQIADRSEAGVAEGARLAEARGARFVDLNCGCPIAQFTGRGLGASLMRKPTKLAQRFSAFILPSNQGAHRMSLVEQHGGEVATDRTEITRRSGHENWTVLCGVYRHIIPLAFTFLSLVATVYLLV